MLHVHYVNSMTMRLIWKYIFLTTITNLGGPNVRWFFLMKCLTLFSHANQSLLIFLFVMDLGRELFKYLWVQMESQCQSKGRTNLEHFEGLSLLQRDFNLQHQCMNLLPLSKVCPCCIMNIFFLFIWDILKHLPLDVAVPTKCNQSS